jgi:hypothetical protein
MQTPENSTSILDKSFQGDYAQNIEVGNNPESKLNIADDLLKNRESGLAMVGR